jgi:hypothetical protein
METAITACGPVHKIYVRQAGQQKASVIRTVLYLVDFQSGNTMATTAMLLCVSFYVIVTTLPATLVYALEGHFQQGRFDMTDAEIASDEQWQRYFNYITARKIVEEVSWQTLQAAFNL